MNTTQKRQKEGSAFITTMLLILLVPLLAGNLLMFSQGNAHQVVKNANWTKAKLIAEAGCNHAYARLRDDFSLASDANAFPVVDFAGGTYDPVVIALNNRAAIIKCEGVYRESVARASIDLYNDRDPDQIIPPNSPWTFSVLNGGNMGPNGSGTMLGKVHSNADIDVNGGSEWGTIETNTIVSCSGDFTYVGNGDIYGTVTSPNISGTPDNCILIEQFVPTIKFPKIDLTYYYNIAAENGMVWPGQTYNSDVILDDLDLHGGILWINGDVIFQKNITYDGCIIATGSITFKGQAHQERIGALPALISRDGSITINGTHDMEGLIYTKGDLTMNGSGTINGSLIVGGSMTLNGNYGVISYDYCQPGDAGGNIFDEDNVYVTAWQE